MSDARKAAAGKPCDLMLPGVCSHDWTTTVLAHVRRKWNAGVGMKPPDEHGIYACFECHRVLDRVAPSRNMTRDEIDQRVAFAVMRRNDVPEYETGGYILDAVLAKVIK